ncbi:multidrug resistance pump, putative [Ricinus communis]|uniref:Protein DETOXIFICATION n=1 Tax=Ricinus communis TaxID=3988 RepID=B9SY90_RICCO|nr:multidrug resistance pump, putative [Ricinus communis]|eukprot:XP_002530959.1 protein DETOXIFICATION 24 [Ricinus communis]
MEHQERLLGSEANDNSDLKRRIWVENKKIWRVGFPAMLARTTQFGMFVVTQAFIGHIGELELAGYALTQIIIIRFVNGILLGMSSATETLCGQAFGAKQFHMMGIYLQRSWIINLVTATILLPVFIFSAQIFRLLGEEDEIADMAGYISLWFIPILYFFAIGLSLQKYLQTQLKNRIVGWISAASFALHVLLSWIFVSILGWGIPGAMSAMIISYWSIIIGTLVYVFCGWCPNSWRGFSLAAFSDLAPAIKLSISSGVMLCLELWYNAVLVLLAGYMKNATTQVSALSICLNITGWEMMLCFAFLTSCTVRISNELGRGDAKAARFAIKVIFTESLCMGIFFFILCLALDRQIARVFTSEENVIEAVSKLSVLLAFSVLLNSFQAVFTGGAVGAGRQGTVAYINICSYYLIGVPIGVVLGYVAHWQIKGIWIGMVIGVVIQVLVLGYITFTTNWHEQVKKASERLGRFLRPSNESSNENSIQERSSS